VSGGVSILDDRVTVYTGDCREVLRTLPERSGYVRQDMATMFGPDTGKRAERQAASNCPHCGAIRIDNQIGLEQTPDAYVAEMVGVFREVRRVLRDDATLWLNLGDSYSTHAAGKVADPMAKSTLAGVKTQAVANESSRAQGKYRKDDTLPEKNLIGIPWRVAFALQADGWYLRQDIIWSKPASMPESVTDRCTKAHEYIFLLSKSPRYHFDAAAIAEKAIGDPGGNVRPTKGAGQDLMRTRNGLHLAQERARQNGGFETRNKRSVWTVPSQAFSESHFATFPPALIEPCILAGCPRDGLVLDPFGGAGTTALVALRHNRRAALIELNPVYAEMARRRIETEWRVPQKPTTVDYGPLFDWEVVA
jgi:DNA modification methylase